MQRRKEEFEERIKLGGHGDYGDSSDNADEELSSDDADEELTIARRANMRSQVECEERQRRRARTGQAKLGKAMSKLILHKALLARIVESPFLQPALQIATEVAKLIRGPSVYECVELLQPKITRFATNFIALESIVRSKQELKEMVTSSAWKRSTYARKPAGLEMMEVINSSEFWKKAVDVLKIQEPLVKVLKMCDGNEKPTMDFIYEAMDRAKLAIQRDYRYLLEILGYH
ncbi:hypothetical protein PVK06_036785 [Gossypium arboreum]|uniref:Uncharacterized protein n=1 Tax=Gossypium arboreum TaxID=29729 RepID=A0ABR0NKI2_GOSAR|nr:hypothetical protein PVK06_036785 [Gossypium arboreum]